MELPGAGGAFNMYGPTECTVTRSARSPRAPITIGRPVNQPEGADPGRGGQPLPVGGARELCLAGWVICGYLNPLSAQEAFIEAALAARNEPIASSHQRSGLLRRDGSIQYLGRIDRQIKLRGYRIEPGR